VEYDTFDILQDEEVRQGLKAYSNWPTYPQLYVKGELIGGLDIIKETDIEIVRSYKYLGVYLNNKLDRQHCCTLQEWSEQTTSPEETQVLRSAGALYDAVVASAIFYGVVCWGSSISTADRKRLNRIKTSSSVLACPPDPVEVVGDRRMRTVFKHMLKNLSHPMYHSLEALGSFFSARLLHPRCVEERLVLHPLYGLSQTGAPSSVQTVSDWCSILCTDCLRLVLRPLYGLSQTGAPSSVLTVSDWFSVLCTDCLRLVLRPLY
ncbi:hypothetical protein NFI96_014769, partial [Prochilodus magdalenae]